MCERIGLKGRNLGIVVTCELSPRNLGDQICQDCKLEISRILLTVDLRVMDMLNFMLSLGWTG